MQFVGMSTYCGAYSFIDYERHLVSAEWPAESAVTSHGCQPTVPWAVMSVNRECHDQSWVPFKSAMTSHECQLKVPLLFKSANQECHNQSYLGILLLYTWVQYELITKIFSAQNWNFNFFFLKLFLFVISIVIINVIGDWWVLNFCCCCFFLMSKPNNTHTKVWAWLTYKFLARPRVPSESAMTSHECQLKGPLLFKSAKQECHDHSWVPSQSCMISHECRPS